MGSGSLFESLKQELLVYHEFAAFIIMDNKVQFILGGFLVGSGGFSADSFFKK